jgi:lipopolysaccharide/colanic/teichoic acid biosynthesis glycosyltransferase
MWKNMFQQALRLHKTNRQLLFVACDILQFNIILLVLYRLEYNYHPLSFLVMFFLMNGLWLIDLILNGKRSITRYESFSDGLYQLFKSCLFMIFCTVSVVALLRLHFPAFFVLKLFGSVLALEAIALAILHLTGRPGRLFRHQTEKRKNGLSAAKFVIDSILYYASFHAVYGFKYGTLRLDNEYALYVTGLYAMILIVSDWMGKYSSDRYKNAYFAFSIYVRSAAVVFALVALGVILFQVKSYSTVLFFGPIVVLLGLELFVLMIRYLAKNGRVECDRIGMVDTAQPILQEQAFVHEACSGAAGNPPRAVLRELLARNRTLYRFLEKSQDLSALDSSDVLLSNADQGRIRDSAGPSSLRLLLCNYCVNDIDPINRFFLDAHALLKNGGCLVGVKDTLQSYKRRVNRKYPPYMARTLILLNVVLSQIIPRIPVMKRIHSLIFKGRNRLITKAELLGRLSFCGFKITHVKSINDKLYFIAQKAGQRSSAENPSFGPVITLKRIGFQGRPIFIKKLRTMHPYSEYIQDYMFEKNGLNSSGKFRNDFRITGPGKWFRKFWIDELPQLLNWIRGDVALIGVRALSEHYFNLYPQDLREMRILHRPGLIPPYYVDMPKSFDEIMRSERRYLEKKTANPFSTDVEYFSKAVFNILFKKARSL